MIGWDNVFFKYLLLESIESDEDFRLTSTYNPRLYSILNISGILSPLWVWETSSNRLVLIDGYSRYGWAKGTGCYTLPCLVFPSSFSKEELLKMRILTKSSESNLSLEEKANIVERLLRLYSAREVERNFLPLFSFPSKPGFSKVIVAFTKTSKEFRCAVREGIIDERIALVLATWDEESRHGMLRLLKKLRCSVSIQREILESVEDLGRAKNIPYSEVLREIEVVLGDQNLSPREGTERVRHFLKALLFPNLMARRNSFEKTLKSLELPYGVELKPPDQFEGDEWEMKVRFSKPQELLDKLKIFNSKISMEVLDKIFYGDRHRSL
ncbi:MAG: ParB/Srx family N-terminal domain-containing protein [Syntrophobacterales bacterium]|nr:ParB/Srx family N-terminal domain-containing protein [Syntrophobacterales bacterium]